MQFHNELMAIPLVLLDLARTATRGLAFSVAGVAALMLGAGVIAAAVIATAVVMVGRGPRHWH